MASASRLLRASGTEGASVANVMQDAGLTHGGFYRHFASKDEMVDAALAHAFDEFIAPLSNIEQGARGDALETFRHNYLSNEHVAHAELGCPAAATGPDIARGAQGAKKAFGKGIARMINLLSAGFTGSAERRRQRAIRQFAMMLGAVVLARASDADMARDVLDACRSDK